MKHIFSILLFFCIALGAYAQNAQECYDKAAAYYKAQNYTEAVKWFRKSAEQGDASAQYMLGACYDNGQGVVQDYTEAVKWYRMAADQGNVYAQSSLGFCYAYGEGVKKNEAEAVNWFRKAAKQGEATAQYNLGTRYAYGEGVTKNEAEAVNWFRKAAEQGHAEAQCDLGVCYFNGQGVPQDYAEALKWWRKAVVLGLDNAQYYLGVCYASGRGVPQDYAEAVKWYRKAADQGNAEAQYNLGKCYTNGQGVSQDNDEAVKWFHRAADQGHAQAIRILDTMCDNILQTWDDLMNEFIEGWYEEATEENDPKAQYVLGDLYYKGEYVQQDYAEAVKWFRKAAEQGHAEAQSKLGICYAKGEGVTKNEAEAVKWYRKAADQGHADAIEALKKLQNHKNIIPEVPEQCAFDFAKKLITTERILPEYQNMAQQVIDTQPTDPNGANHIFSQILNNVKKDKAQATAVGKIFLDYNVYPCAKQCANAAVNVDANYVPGLMINVGLRLFRRQYAEAINQLETIIQLAPNDIAPKRLLFFTLLNDKRYEEAAKIVKKYINDPKYSNVAFDDLELSIAAAAL